MTAARRKEVPENERRERKVRGETRAKAKRESRCERRGEISGEAREKL